MFQFPAIAVHALRRIVYKHQASLFTRIVYKHHCLQELFTSMRTLLQMSESSELFGVAHGIQDPSIQDKFLQILY